MVTREFIKQLRERNVDDGHVIFMNRYISFYCVITKCKSSIFSDVISSKTSLFQNNALQNMCNFTVLMIVKCSNQSMQYLMVTFMHATYKALYCVEYNITHMYRAVGSNFSVVRPTSCRAVCMQNLG